MTIFIAIVMYAASLAQPSPTMPPDLGVIYGHRNPPHCETLPDWSIWCWPTEEDRLRLSPFAQYSGEDIAGVYVPSYSAWYRYDWAGWYRFDRWERAWQDATP